MSYGNALDFRTYHDVRNGIIPATWTDAMIDKTLLVASEWLDAGFRNLWVGYPKDGFVQVRQWPRKDAFIRTHFETHLIPDTTIPTQVTSATYEAAFKELTQQGSLNIDLASNLFKTVSVDGAVEVQYDKSINSTSEVQNKYPVIQNLMAELIDPFRSAISNLSGSTQRT